MIRSEADSYNTIQINMPVSYSLYELNEYIRRVIALNFSEPIWVDCEIAQVKEVRGNVYLDLVYHDKNTNEITAQISANIWYKSFLFLKNKLGALLPSLLKEGTHVLIKVQVEFSERYGIKLIVEDIDPSFTIGQMEMNRQKILQKLQDEGLTHLNKLTKLPSVVQHIAVISSENAAGYIDFKNHLLQNVYGYQYEVTLFQAALQGQNTEREVCHSLDSIFENVEKYDCILIIRGGGSRLDLAWFDNFNIGAKIGKSVLPVLTGIGHDIDSTVADIVAHASLKTPTAVADFLIQHNLNFETNIADVMHWISQLGKRMLGQHEILLSQTIQFLKILPMEIIRKHNVSIENNLHQMYVAVKNKLSKHRDLVHMADRQITLLDPINVLKRGYALIRQEDKIISRSKNLSENKEIDIQFYDGIIKINKQ